MPDLPKAYNAQDTESKWYHYWAENDLFTADPTSSKPPYCIVIPPPNVTGTLHMGHALVNTLQDILIRWKRMSGFEALWVPGTDHAGIATQTIVEKHLIKTEGKRRKDYSRNEFLDHIWAWKEKHESRILEQLKRMGCSCDWSRLRFTMDRENNRAVKKMFKKMYDEGLIYRGDYLVNWDPVTQTALADDEVEYEEHHSFLWHIKYPFKDGSGYAHVATTRPETMLGDSAVAIAPNDERYKHLIGKTVMLPLQNREIPIIVDRHVDPEFGSGMVKITPAHDPNDYQIGLNHNLPFINIMTPDGKVNENGGEFQGMTMEEAREAVVEQLKKLDLLEKVEPHVHRKGVSYRSKATIEPYMSKQWFIRMDDFAKTLREAMESKQVQIIPKNWESSYFHWIDNLRDWCISRQLWWGHRIPIWYNKEDPEKIICYDGLGVPPEVEKEPKQWYRDEDVLDTWFSSALWPFAALGWPEETAELKKFYPNAVLVTGHDILFFWVARMILMGKYAFEEVPFPQIFLHGLIYAKSYWREDPKEGVHYIRGQERLDYDLGKPIPKEVKWKWEKMSKSKGNVIDPLEIIDEYGTDAMRMALCASATQARQIDLDRRRFEEFKNFTNKIWNGARFVLMNLELNGEIFAQGLDEKLLTLPDRWILSVLGRRIQKVTEYLENHQFDQAAIAAYDFYWKEFCAYYVETAKPVLFGKAGVASERVNKQKMLVIVLSNAIRLMHPMAPFITEELFDKLKETLGAVPIHDGVDPYTAETVKALNCAACIVAPYPTAVREDDVSKEIEKQFELMNEAVYKVRNIRGEMKIPPNVATDLYIVGDANDKEIHIILENEASVSALVPIKSCKRVDKEPELEFASTSVFGKGHPLIVPLPPELVEKEITRLNKEKEKLTQAIDKLKAQLDNPGFVNNAPEKLVAQQRTLLEKSEKELNEIMKKLAR